MFPIASNTDDSGITYVDDVFSTYLYTGNGSTQTITNGIDLAGKGGLVWFKPRNTGNNNNFIDSQQGINKFLISNDVNAAESVNTGYGVTSFNSNGFSLGNPWSSSTNTLSTTYASWTFRKAAKFFDIVTYTGDGTSTQTVSHNLGIVAGCIIIKRTDIAENWTVFHQGNGTGNAWTKLSLNTTGAGSQGTPQSTVTASYFKPNDIYGGSSSPASSNVNGATYVAYLFAHDTSSTGMIQCGSYTGNGSATGPVVSLGWEPQYLMIKNATGTGSWQIIDNMRGMTVGANDAALQANASTVETAVDYVSPTVTGFQVTSTSSEVNTNTVTYIYMAIRRPNKPPTSGTEVFSPSISSGTASGFISSGFTVDVEMGKARNSTQSFFITTRLTDRTLTSDTTAAEVDDSAYCMFNVNNGYINNGFYSPNPLSLMFKRAPGFFDVTTWLGNSQSVGVDNFRIQPHNLGAAPEFVIIKNRGNTWDWWCYHRGCTKSTSGLKEQYVVKLNKTDAEIQLYGDEAGVLIPDALNFYLPAGSSQLNQTGYNYVAYLFATLAGISKVGSYTGNGSSQTINCGFAAGARFILIKCKSAIGDWYVWDTARSIVAANDPHLSLNTTVAEVITDDSIDPDNSGFIVNQVAATNINVTSATYIYLAIA